jgi:hypothetical protein
MENKWDFMVWGKRDEGGFDGLNKPALHIFDNSSEQPAIIFCLICTAGLCVDSQLLITTTCSETHWWSCRRLKPSTLHALFLFLLFLTTSNRPIRSPSPNTLLLTVLHP